MVLDGLVYKGLKPVYWSPSSQTALAEAEVEYYDVDSPSIYVALEIVDKNGSQKVKNGDKLVIWTTTPWTLLANACCGNWRKLYILQSWMQQSRLYCS
nr:class I tRNA ligase family protein [Mycoplasmopsis bovis]